MVLGDRVSGCWSAGLWVLSDPITQLSDHMAGASRQGAQSSCRATVQNCETANLLAAKPLRAITTPPCRRVSLRPICNISAVAGTGRRGRSQCTGQLPGGCSTAGYRRNAARRLTFSRSLNLNFTAATLTAVLASGALTVATSLAGPVLMRKIRHMYSVSGMVRRLPQSRYSRKRLLLDPKITNERAARHLLKCDRVATLWAIPALSAAAGYWPIQCG